MFYTQELHFSENDCYDQNGTTYTSILGKFCMRTNVHVAQNYALLQPHN